MKNKIVSSSTAKWGVCPLRLTNGPDQRGCFGSDCMAWIVVSETEGCCGMVPFNGGAPAKIAPPPPPRKVAPPPPREEARELRKYFGARKTNIFGTVSPTENDDD